MANPAKVIQLTKPTKKGASSQTPKLEVAGFEIQIATMRQRLGQIESLEAQQAIDEKLVVDRVKANRIEAEAAGNLYKTALVNSADGIPAKVTFKNQFRQISCDHEGALRMALKTTYDALFTTKHEVKVRDGVTLDQLKAALGDKLELLFDVTPYIAPHSDFMEKRASFRRALDKNTNTTLDNVTDQAQYKPQFNLK